MKSTKRNELMLHFTCVTILKFSGVCKSSFFNSPSRIEFSCLADELTVISQHPLSWTLRGLDACSQRCHHCLAIHLKRGCAQSRLFIVQGLAVYSYHSLCTTSETNVIVYDHKDSALHHLSMLDLCSSEISEAFLHKHKTKDESLLQQSQFQSQPFEQLMKNSFEARRQSSFPGTQGLLKSSLICCPCKLAHTQKLDSLKTKDILLASSPLCKSLLDPQQHTI